MAYDRNQPTCGIPPPSDRHRSIASIVLLAGLALTATAAEPISYGHADFVPTAEQPVSFRNHGAWYPGATPPLAFSDGTPIQREMVLADGKKSKVFDVADAKAKNILWKSPLPGWSLSHPIVVGQRVFAVGDPDFVVCFAADSGKELWRRRITMPLVNGLSEGEAAKAQKAIDLAQALHYVSAGWAYVGNGERSLFDINGPDTVAEGRRRKAKDPVAFMTRRKAEAATVIAMLNRHRTEVEAIGDPALVKALDADIACIANLTTLADYDAFLALKPGTFETRRSHNLRQACELKYKMSSSLTWRGYLGQAESTLASDGERIYGCFLAGQIFCLDLDGKTVWLARGVDESLIQANAWFNSPILCGDVLMVRSVSPDRKIKGNDTHMVGLDKRTGKQLWRSPPQLGRLFGNSPVMRLTGPDGKPVPVLLTSNGNAVLRVSDGKLLHSFKPNDWNSTHIFDFGARFIVGSRSDGGFCRGLVQELRFTGPDTVSAELLFELNNGTRSVLSTDAFKCATDRLLFAACAGKGMGIYDMSEQGRCLGTFPGSDESAWVVAGRYLIGQTDGADGTSPYGRTRDDRKAVNRFRIVDISDPTKPKVVSEDNVLAYREPAADLHVQTYLTDFDPLDFSGCYKGSASYFGTMMSGVVPHGKRIYIQSSAFLYCVGEP